MDAPRPLKAVVARRQSTLRRVLALEVGEVLTFERGDGALLEAAGKPLFKEMIELAREQGEGTVDYVWRNPATNAVEQKHSLIQRVDDVLLGVGYYAPN
jgi:hypothetical protein